jgi:hypothetical protein
MANGDSDYIPITRRTPPDEEEEARRRRAVSPQMQTLPSTTTTTEAAPRRQWEQAETLPSTGAQPELPSHRMQARSDYLHGKLYPEQKDLPQTRLGKFGRTMGIIGQDIGVAIRPDIMANIPGTNLNRRLEYNRLQNELGPEYYREAETERAKELTGIEKGKLQLEQEKVRAPHRLEGPMDTYTGPNGQVLEHWQRGTGPTFWLPAGATPPAEGTEPLPPAAGTPGTLGQGTPPAAQPGTLPQAQAQEQGPMASPPPGGYYGKQPEGQIPLRPDELKQVNEEAASYYARLHKGEKIPPTYQLKTGATKEDAARLQEMLTKEEGAAGIQAQHELAASQRADTASREAEALQLRKDEAAGKWLYAVDNNGKTHYITRGDYEAHQRDFKPNPGTLPPGSVERVKDHNTILNEMQGRMNALSESAQKFPWQDSGQMKLVIQAMQNIEKNYPDQVLGIPIVSFVAHNLKQLGLAGANPQTRQYIVDLIGLREAMLGMPKEITGGSRLMQPSVEALYATLPSGETPDLDYAMRQLLVSQSTLDRLRGSRVPIIEGMDTIPKLPNLYGHSATDDKTGKKYYSDDRIHWVDENGEPVKRKK